MKEPTEVETSVPQKVYLLKKVCIYADYRWE